MANSAEDIRAAIRRTKELQDNSAVSSQNGPGSSNDLRDSAEPSAVKTSPRIIGRIRNTDSLPPHSVEAEKGVLGSMLQAPATCIPIARQRITDEQLFSPQHRVMFSALLNFYEERGSFDLTEFTVWAMEAGQDKAMGGPPYITEVHLSAPPGGAIDYFLDIVCDKYLVRQIIEASAESVREASEPGVNVSALVEHIQERAVRLASLARPRKGDLTVRTPNELIGMMFDDTDNYFGDRILAAGQQCTLIGPGGVGKSRLSLQLAVCMITGRDFLGMPTRAKGKKWLFIQTENSNRRLHYDLKQIFSGLALMPDEVASVNRHLFIHTLENDSDCFLNLLNPQSYTAVNRLVQEVQPDFVAWDPLNSLTDSDLNSDMDMRAIVSTISSVTRARNPNRVPLVLHHSLTGKIGAARAVGWDKASYGRNSKALHAWTRAQINLAPRSPDNPQLLIMSCGKNNNGRPFPELGLRFDEQLGIYVKDEAFDPDEFREEVGIGRAKPKSVTPEDVAALCEDGIPKPKLAARIREEFGIQQRAAYDAINRTEDAGLIRKNKGHNWPSTYSRVSQERRSYDDDRM